MEVKLEAQSGLGLGNALYPSFEDISGQGGLQRGQAGGEALLWPIWSSCVLSQGCS